MRMITKLITAMLLSCLIFVIGCSKINQENFSKLKRGMDYNEVTDILGNPDNCTESRVVKGCTWGDEDRNIKINFMGGKTVGLSSKGIK